MAFNASLTLVVNDDGGDPRPASSLTGLSIPDTMESTLCSQNQELNPGMQSNFPFL